MPENLAVAGPIHQRCLQTVSGQSFEAGRRDDDHPRDQLPDIDKQDCRHGVLRIAQPVDAFDAEKAQQIIDHARVSVQHHAP